MKSKKLLIAGAVVASIALLAMLTYNFVHTGGLLASYVQPRGVGYAAAFGIELAVVALSVAIGTRRWHGMQTRWFEAVLAAVLLVSFMANVHCAAATENFVALEHHSVDVPWWEDLVTGIGKPIVAKGYARVPEAPGLGVDLNEEVVKQHLADDAEYFAPTEAWNQRQSWDRTWS